MTTWQTSGQYSTGPLQAAISPVLFGQKTKSATKSTTEKASKKPKARPTKDLTKLTDARLIERLQGHVIEAMLLATNIHDRSSGYAFPKVDVTPDMLIYAGIAMVKEAFSRYEYKTWNTEDIIDKLDENGDEASQWFRALFPENAAKLNRREVLGHINSLEDRLGNRLGIADDLDIQKLLNNPPPIHRVGMTADMRERVIQHLKTLSITPFYTSISGQEQPYIQWALPRTTNALNRTILARFPQLARADDDIEDEEDEDDAEEASLDDIRDELKIVFPDISLDSETALKHLYKLSQTVPDASDTIDEKEPGEYISYLPADTMETIIKSIKKMDRFANSSSEMANQAEEKAEALLEIPWRKKVLPQEIDLRQAKRQLNKNLRYMDKAKDRVLDYISILSERNHNQVADAQRPRIICLSGPPGVGKTSIARAIAEVLGRDFTKINLGLINDPESLTGDREVWLGSKEGVFAKAFKEAGSMNPVILLDEIDKLGQRDGKDPYNVLNHFLDPDHNDQNVKDSFLDINLDLSDSFIILTANNLEKIPGYLRERMEIIELRAYTKKEKFEILRKNLLERKFHEVGLKVDKKPSRYTPEIPDATIQTLIDSYDRTAGVRNLETLLEKVFGRYIRLQQENKWRRNGGSLPLNSIYPTDLVRILGPAREKQVLRSRIGRVYGLAYFPGGGSVMAVETKVLPYDNPKSETPRLEIKRKIGDIDESLSASIDAAFTYVQNNIEELGIELEDNTTYEVTIGEREHTEVGGPSGGSSYTIGLISAFLKKPVRSDVVMTGTIDMDGYVGEIGGLSNKLIAAVDAGAKTAIISKENKKDLIEVPKEIKSALEIVVVEHITEAMPHAFTDKGDPTPVSPLLKRKVAFAGNHMFSDQAVKAKVTFQTSA